MTIWIDADACPRAVQDIVFRAALRRGLDVCRVANRDLAPHASPRIRSVRVGRGFDAADAHIAREAVAPDIVITADIPLAAQVIANGVRVIDPRGDVLDEDNVGTRMGMRELLTDLRAAGAIAGGPAPLGKHDVQRFANALDRLLSARR